MNQQEEADAPSGVPGWIVGLVGFAAFLSGTASGVLIDGTAEVVNEFYRRSPAACQQRPEVVPAPTTATSPSVNARPALHGNNAIDWSVTVPQGTPTGTVEMRNGDPIHGWAVSFASAVDGTPAATLWISPGSTARLSLPTGRWSVLTRRLDPDGKAIGIGTPLGHAVVTDESGPVVLAAPSDGTWRPVAPSAARRPKTRTRPAQDEYEGLGRGSVDGGTSTYGG